MSAATATAGDGTKAVHWRCYRTRSGNYKATAYKGCRQRSKSFTTRLDAAQFIEVMKMRTTDEQVAWLFEKAPGKRKFSTVWRMQTEWARKHPQVRVVGGWRGRPCGGGNIGVKGRSAFATVAIM